MDVVTTIYILSQRHSNTTNGLELVRDLRVYWPIFTDSKMLDDEPRSANCRTVELSNESRNAMLDTKQVPGGRGTSGTEH